MAHKFPLFLWLLLALSFANVQNTQANEVASGQLITKLFTSKLVTPRNVHVWLPNDYNEQHQYAVLYMHDGQMLFDANTTWNKQEWGVDEIASELIKSQKVRPFIVVGIDNDASKRHSDYYPQKPFNALTKEQLSLLHNNSQSNNGHLFSEQVNSDNYLAFLVNEVKPYIDSTYSVDSRQQSTFILGSSMGGLISLYALGEYPDVFGGAACLSTHWPGVVPHNNNPVPATFTRYVQQHLPTPGQHKVYFDYGDQTLDAYYPKHQKDIDVIVKEKGYNSTNWQTLFFKGHNHSENAWRSRLDKPLVFLLAK